MVEVCYKTGPVECEGRVRCQTSALGLVQQSPVGGCLHPPERATGPNTVAQEEAVPGALLLGNGKGLFHLDLATVCNDHILQGLVPTIRLGALHLPYYFLGRKGKGRVGQEICHSRETGPSTWPGRTESHVTNSLQISRHQHPRILARCQPRTGRAQF